MRVGEKEEVMYSLKKITGRKVSELDLISMELLKYNIMAAEDIK